MAPERNTSLNYLKAFPKVSVSESEATNLISFLTRYQLLSVDVRSHFKTGIQSQDRFFTEFDTNHAAKLCNTHLKILISRKEQFVGTKTLNSSLRFVASSFKTTKMRKMCMPHIQTILYELTLPLLMMTQYEMHIW